MNLEVILRAGLSTGTILIFATIGEIITERSGVMNLGVEGMMLIGAMAAFKVSHVTQNAWLGLLAGILAGGILSLAHFPLLSLIPVIGRIFFTDFNLLVYVGYFLVPLSWYFIYKTRPGMHLRAVGEKPSAADSLGVNVYATRYLYTFIGGCLAGLAGASISIAISPGWYSNLTTSGQGWIAIALVIFARWNPVPAALGGYLFGMLRRFTLDLQGPMTILGFRNPFFYDHNLVFFLQMMPFLLTIIALLWGSGAARRKRKGAPSALGVPYIRGERGL